MQVFLSHASPDKPTARRIRSALESCGLRVWFDEVDIRVGQSIPKEVGDGLGDSDAICLLISSASEQSRWVSREANSFLMRALGSQGLLLPCRLDETNPPPLLIDLKYADFRSSFDDGIASLLGAVHVREAVEEAEQTRLAGATLREQLSADSVAFFVVYFESDNKFYVGDRRELDAPYKLLDTLAASGALNRWADRREIGWELTNRGKTLLDKFRPEVDAEARERMTTLIKDNRLRR